jgi:uncharacterized protein YecE (DUF72 family)
MNIWVGTSGYSYPDWVGPVYPEGTRPNRLLAYYATQFPLVELNFTFYRPPTPEMLARLGDQVPDGFQFLVKVPRSVSHEEKPLDLPLFRRAVEELRRRGHLLGLLCQLPQASHYTRRRLEWLDWLGGELHDYRLAFEFRHRSWARPDLTAWLAERRLDLVAVDAPALPQLFPSGLVQSGSRIYVRLHSRNGDNWYLSDRERYDFHYDDSRCCGRQAVLRRRCCCSTTAITATRPATPAASCRCSETPGRAWWRPWLRPRPRRSSAGFSTVWKRSALRFVRLLREVPDRR